MNRILELSIHDFRIIFRDKVLMVILFIPVIMIAILVWAVPAVIGSYHDAADYYPLIVGAICVVTAISPAYVISFIMLDEKDEGVLTVIRVLPLPPIHFLIYRVLFVLIFGFLTSLITLTVSDLSINLFMLLLMSLFIALIAPMSALTIMVFCQNKIEGLTFLKGINFLTILPVFSFFTGTLGKIILGGVPTFWIYHCLMNLGSTRNFLFYFIIGSIFYGFIFKFLFARFRQKVF